MLGNPHRSEDEGVVFRQYLPKTMGKFWLSKHVSVISVRLHRERCDWVLPNSIQPCPVKYARYPSYADSTWETTPNQLPLRHSAMTVFTVSAELSHFKVWRGQCSSIYKTPGQNINPRPFRIVPIFSVSIPICPHISEVYPKDLHRRFVRDEFRLLRAFDLLWACIWRPIEVKERVDQRCSRWMLIMQDRDCGLDETMVGIDLVGIERLVWRCVLCHSIIDQLPRYFEIWLKWDVGVYFTPSFEGDTVDRRLVFTLHGFDCHGPGLRRQRDV